MNDQNATVVDPVSIGEAVEMPSIEADSTPVKNIAGAGSAGATETPPVSEGLSIHNLQIGQRLTGKVKNIADFGAFVDIGIAQDGLVHISELAKQNVEKVTDVVSQGQEVEVWVKKVDTKRGRVSLTMIKPIALKLKDVAEDAEVEGVVTRLEPYGAFVDIGTDRDGLVHISQITYDYIKHPEDALTVGQKVKVKVLKVNRKKRQVDLSMKALLPPPPPPEEVKKVDEVKPQSRRQEAVEEAEAFEEEPIPTAMAVAYAALHGELPYEKSGKGGSSAKGKGKHRREMDDIIARTLANRS
ncbi:MAG: hypothetical protein DPW09_40815 [Anaerolineae bacterium]|nr:S1 RNA-binding domain-containing protein [Anaerolineales bacterium]MCQ3979802.1 hypothetical protein [Anaerolineae bacterium]